MPEFKDWIIQVKSDDPTLASFVTKLDQFFTDNGFNGPAFEKAVTVGLNAIEKKTTESFTRKIDAKS